MNYDDENLKIIEDNILELMPLEYVKNYLRIDNNCDDEFIKNIIYFAVEYAEKMTGKMFGTKKYELSFLAKEQISKIDKTPILIGEILIFSIDDTEILTSEYNLKNGVIYLNKTKSGNVKMTFISHGNDILADIKQAMLFHIASIYQYKNGDCLIPQATQEIYSLYRKIKI